MSIWIHNTLTVTGDFRLVEEFMKKAEGFKSHSYAEFSGIPIISKETNVKTLFSLESFIKPSKEQQVILAEALSSKDKEISKNAVQVLNEWRMRNWGTRRDLIDVKRSKLCSGKYADKNNHYVSVTYSFDTTYTLCDIALKEISRQNRYLFFSLEYISFDEGLYGDIDFDGGDIVRYDKNYLTDKELEDMEEDIRFREEEIRNSMIEESRDNISGIYKSSEVTKVSEVSGVSIFSKDEVNEILDFLN